MGLYKRKLGKELEAQLISISSSQFCFTNIYTSMIFFISRVSSF
jgi:hypothetical protein